MVLVEPILLICVFLLHLQTSSLPSESGEGVPSHPVPLGLADANFHSIDELPPPCGDTPTENTGETAGPEDLPNSDASGGYLAALSHSLATASNVLEEANRMARAIQPLSSSREENGLDGDDADENRSDDGSLQSPGSPSAPDSFDLISSVDSPCQKEPQSWQAGDLSG